MPDHEIYHQEGNAVSLAFSGGELKVKEAGTSHGFAVRTLVDGRLGFGYAQNEADLGKTIESAGRISRFSVKSGFTFAPKASYPTLDIFDPTLDTSDLDMFKGFVDQAKDAASFKGGKPRVISSMLSSRVRIENTIGLSGEYAKTEYSLYAECMNGDGYGFAYHSSNHKPAEVEGLGRKAAEMALAMQGATKPPTGTYTVVFEVEALDSLIETLLPSFSGDWKRRAITKLSSGSKMFSEMFSLSEDGLSNGTGARPFDDEGTPSSRKSLVEKGVVGSFLYDRETAALASMGDSGACSRDSYAAPPGISWSNIIVSPGTWKNLGDLERYIEVHYAHGSHTANMTSGDIGLEASSAFMVEKGKRKPMKGFMITGNVFDFFANIEAIETEQKTYGQLISPRIAFKDIKIVS